MTTTVALNPFDVDCVNITSTPVGFQPQQPIVQDLLNGDWKLHEPLHYHAPDGRSWKIRKGFITDYGSIPEALDWIPGLDTNGTDADCPFILHDYLYHSHECEGRKDADTILYEALLVCGVGRFRAGVIYAGVRVGGGWAWNRQVRPG